ncbi:MAG: hypothetical protein E6Q88_09495 [Lysobacteraceae bacterium]|nr:MAG: hypothetical protein E6Q88_09495 [Xanthomonadaceae bacterium]
MPGLMRTLRVASFSALIGVIAMTLGCEAGSASIAPAQNAGVHAGTLRDHSNAKPADAGHATAAEISEAIDAAPPAGSARPLPFAGRETVSVAELFAAMREEAAVIATSPAIGRDYRRLLARHRLREADLALDDYVRVKLAFEATRAGGLWGVAWTVTDRQPQSDAVWAQWRALRLPDDRLPDITATAECDELSALFAFVAHGMGVSRKSRLGLFWPTHNHTVAVWMIEHARGETRIVAPTSQIFLDGAQSLDTRGFDPTRQRRIYDYRREDAAATTRLPAALARGFIAALRRDGGRGEDELQRNRNARESRQWRQLGRRG